MRAGHETDQPGELGGAVEDVLNGNTRLCRPVIEAAGLVIRGVGGPHFAEGNGDALGQHPTDHGALIGGAVAARGLGGDLHRHVRHHPGHLRDEFPVEAGIEAVAALRIAHMGMKRACALGMGGAGGGDWLARVEVPVPEAGELALVPVGPGGEAWTLGLLDPAGRAVDLAAALPYRRTVDILLPIYGNLDAESKKRSELKDRIILNSMHKFQPRIHLVITNRNPSTKAELQSLPHQTYQYSQTTFTAVTAYQNQLV